MENNGTDHEEREIQLCRLSDIADILWGPYLIKDGTRADSHDFGMRDRVELEAQSVFLRMLADENISNQACVNASLSGEDFVGDTQDRLCFVGGDEIRAVEDAGVADIEHGILGRLSETYKGAGNYAYVVGVRGARVGHDK